MVGVRGRGREGAPCGLSLGTLPTMAWATSLFLGSGAEPSPDAPAPAPVTEGGRGRNGWQGQSLASLETWCLGITSVTTASCGLGREEEGSEGDARTVCLCQGRREARGLDEDPGAADQHAYPPRPAPTSPDCTVWPQGLQLGNKPWK